MNKRIIGLLVFSLLVAFSNPIQAVELFETGNVNIHGFISQGYLQSGGNNFFADTKDDGTLQYSEAAVNFTTDVSDRLSLGVQLFSRDLGKMGNHELTVDWAFADYSFTDWLNLKAGKVKLPFGLYNTERDVDMLRTFVFLPQSFYYEGWRDSSNALNGAGFYGYIEAGFFGAFSYEAYLGNSIVRPDAGVARMLKDQTPAFMEIDLKEVNVQYTNAGTLTWESIFGLDGLKVRGSAWAIEFEAETSYWDGQTLNVVMVGATPLIGPGAGYVYDTGATQASYFAAIAQATADGYTGFKAMKQGTFEVRNFTTAFSLEYVYDNLVFAAEVMQNNYDLDLVGTAVDTDFKTLGWYSSVTYRFTDWFELGTYYSEYYSDDDDKDGKDGEAEYVATGGLSGVSQAHEQYLKDICLTARFDLSANWVLKIEGHQMEGASLLYKDDDNTNADGTTDFEKDWYLGAMKLTYSF